LSKRLEEMTVVSEPPENQSKIYFSATVTLEDEDSNQVIYKIVGPDELDPQKGHISVDAPLGRALLGKEVDSEIEIDSPQGKKIYYVLAISY
jgi:transcription elongation factor GreB